MKKTLKLVFIALLLISIIAVPVIGVSFYDSPSIFDDNAILTNIKFGGGTTVYLSLDTVDPTLKTEDSLNKTAETLENRFIDRGYTDAKVSVKDSTLRLDVSQKDYIDTLIASVCSLGQWSFVGSDSTTTLCNATMVKDAYVSANPNGGYSITLEFTKEGKSEFFANTSSYAASGASFYLMMDGSYAALATISDATVRDTFSFGQYEYSSAASVASMIKHGELPANVKIEKIEALAPALSTTTLTVIYSVIALILVALIALMILIGKVNGAFAVSALISNIAIFLTAMANASYQLNFVTLSTMTVCLVLAGIFYIAALVTVKKNLSGTGSVSSSAIKALNKVSLKGFWAHVIVLAIALICMMFTHGTILYIARIALLFTCADTILYFIFVYFGIRTLAE